MSKKISAMFLLSIFVLLMANNTCYAKTLHFVDNVIPTGNYKLSYQDISDEEEYKSSTDVIGNGAIDNYIIVVDAENKSLLLGDTEKHTIVFFSGEKFILSPERLWYTNLNGETDYYELTNIPENSVSDAILMVFSPNSSHTSLNFSFN